MHTLADDTGIAAVGARVGTASANGFAIVALAQSLVPRLTLHVSEPHTATSLSKGVGVGQGTKGTCVVEHSVGRNR